MENTRAADQAKKFKAIADGNRIAIIRMLTKGEKCVCEIWPKLDLPQNLASHHLKALKDAGLIKSRKTGLRVFYSIDRTGMKDIQKSFKNLFSTI